MAVFNHPLATDAERAEMRDFLLLVGTVVGSVCISFIVAFAFYALVSSIARDEIERHEKQKHL
jgi:uncharacterized protein (DUF2062 family)